MDILEALVSLGINQGTLSKDQKQALDTDGLLYLPGVLSGPEVDEINRRTQQLLDEEGAKAGAEVHQEAGTDRLADLINKGPMFLRVLRERRLLAAVAQVLRWDFKLSSLSARAALPGEGGQGLHCDFRGATVTPGDYQVCNSLWLLDDFTPDNGATRAVPGTQRSGMGPVEAKIDCKADHPDQKLLLGKAGDVYVFNSHTWHGGTTNRTARPRRAMFAYFCRRDYPQMLDQAKNLRPETRATLSQPERVILGVE